MANTSATIKNSWTLLAFRGKFDKMQIGKFTHVDEETGEEQHFKSCIFSEGDAKTFVSISSKLGNITPSDIVQQKDDLQVVEWQTEDKHGYTLCAKSDKAWEDVDL